MADHRIAKFSPPAMGRLDKFLITHFLLPFILMLLLRYAAGNSEGKPFINVSLSLPGKFFARNIPG
jgi:hypothetical protein